MDTVKICSDCEELLEMPDDICEEDGLTVCCWSEPIDISKEEYDARQ